MCTIYWLYVCANPGESSIQNTDPGMDQLTLGPRCEQGPVRKEYCMLAQDNSFGSYKSVLLHEQHRSSL